MVKIIKYTGEKTFMFPNGALATKEDVLKQFPAALAFVHIVETDENEEIMWALQNLSAVRSQLGIDSSLSEDEAIVAIQEIRNTVPEPESTEATAEERIAAALEYQVMASLPDEESTESEVTA